MAGTDAGLEGMEVIGAPSGGVAAYKEALGCTFDPDAANRLPPAVYDLLEDGGYFTAQQAWGQAVEASAVEEPTVLGKLTPTALERLAGGAVTRSSVDFADPTEKYEGGGNSLPFPGRGVYGVSRTAAQAFALEEKLHETALEVRSLLPDHTDLGDTDRLIMQSLISTEAGSTHPAELDLAGYWRRVRDLADMAETMHGPMVVINRRHDEANKKAFSDIILADDFSLREVRDELALVPSVLRRFVIEQLYKITLPSGEEETVWQGMPEVRWTVISSLVSIPLLGRDQIARNPDDSLGLLKGLVGDKDLWATLRGLRTMRGKLAPGDKPDLGDGVTAVSGSMSAEEFVASAPRVRRDQGTAQNWADNVAAGVHAIKKGLSS